MRRKVLSALKRCCSDGNPKLSNVAYAGDALYATDACVLVAVDWDQEGGRPDGWLSDSAYDGRPNDEVEPADHVMPCEGLKADPFERQLRLDGRDMDGTVGYNPSLLIEALGVFKAAGATAVIEDRGSMLYLEGCARDDAGKPTERVRAVVMGKVV